MLNNLLRINWACWVYSTFCSLEKFTLRLRGGNDVTIYTTRDFSISRCPVSWRLVSLWIFKKSFLLKNVIRTSLNLWDYFDPRIWSYYLFEIHFNKLQSLPTFKRQCSKFLIGNPWTHAHTICFRQKKQTRNIFSVLRSEILAIVTLMKRNYFFGFKIFYFFLF